MSKCDLGWDKILIYPMTKKLSNNDFSKFLSFKMGKKSTKDQEFIKYRIYHALWFELFIDIHTHTYAFTGIKRFRHLVTLV